MEKIIVLSIPFLGTAFGAAMVFFLKGKMNRKLEKILLGFASGVMMAASVWSLLMPAIELEQQQGGIAWFPAAAGFLMGVGFLLALDRLVPRLRPEGKKQGEADADIQKTVMLVLAVGLHNLPEGMAVGVVAAGAMVKDSGITMLGALALAVGIAIQNFPEGAIISMPLRNVGVSRAKAFWYGVLSGAVEPVGAAVTILLANQVVPVLPYLLSFAAGAMIYVVADELIPGAGAENRSKAGTIGVALGFVLMMILDVAV